VHRYRRATVVAFALLGVLLLEVPTVLAGTPLATGSSLAAGGLLPGVSASLNVSGTGFNVSPLYWGTTVTPHAYLFPDEGAFINATPARVIVWPGGFTGDLYDPIHDLIYPSAGGLNASGSRPDVSEAQFVQFCESIQCTAIFQVPGEIDNSTLAAQIVNYTENTLHFHPVAWEIGNEPELWRDWRVSWGNWTATKNCHCYKIINPYQYAMEEARYISAMRKVDPAIRIIGIPGTGRPENHLELWQWVQNVTYYDGANISTIAFHNYPAPIANVTNVSLSQFYSYLAGPVGLTDRYQNVTRWVTTYERSTSPTDPACWSQGPSQDCSLSCHLYAGPSGCNISVWVTEIGSGLSHGGYGNLSGGFAGGIDMAAQMVQGLDARVPNIDLFATDLNTNNSWIGQYGEVRDDYTVYSTLLSRLGSVVYPVVLHPTGTGSSQSDHNLSETLYAIKTVAPADGNRTDLLLVNLNVTSAVYFNASPAGFLPNRTIESYSWTGIVNNNSTYVQPSTVAPVVGPVTFAHVTNFTLPPQSAVVLESYPGGGASVSYPEHGLPGGARWYLDEDGTPHPTNGTNVTLLLPFGRHSAFAPPLGLPLNQTLLLDRHQETGTVSNSLVLTNSTAQTVPVTFTEQWATYLGTIPLGGGTITPDLAWADANTTVSLTARAAPGFIFSHWTGFGNGSINSSSPTIQVTVRSWFRETAVFDDGYPVTFTESGLPAGHPWGAELAGTFENTTNTSLTIYAANGSARGFSILPVPGYRPLPASGKVAVQGAPVNVAVKFVSTARYPVTFDENGLPPGTAWNVSVGSTNLTSTNASVSTTEVNGTYHFWVAPVASYRSFPLNGSVSVSGGPTNVSLTFANRTALFPVYVDESGLPTGLNWSFEVAGVTYNQTAPSIVLEMPNGSYWPHVGEVAGYQLSAPIKFHVTGAPVTVPVVFLTLFPVEVEERGLPNGTAWSVEVRATRHTVTSATLYLNETNGSYAINVTAPPGWRSVPTHGNFTVAGRATSYTVEFVSTSTYAVTFQEVGLPNATEWSVAVSGLRLSSSSGALVVPLVNGSYGYSVLPVPGFRPVPKGHAFVVDGQPLEIPITFYVLTGYPPYYPVTWTESGLPSGTRWSLDVRGTTITGSGTSLTLPELNGSYGYQLTPVVGFHDTTPNVGFLVEGAPVTVPLVFVALPTAFPVDFTETGLWSPVNWSIEVAGVPHTFVRSVGSLSLPNGSFTAVVRGPSGFIPVPRVIALTMGGAPLSVNCTFVQATFALRVVAEGLPQSLIWHIRVADSDREVVGPALDLDEANGSYTYDVQAPTGYFPSPSHGEVRVQDDPVNLTVAFFSVGHAFFPPGVTVTSLAIRAISVAGVGSAAAIGTFVLLGAAYRRRRGRTGDDF
jgi:hypothetical protein